jgi:hypothetical protein
MLLFMRALTNSQSGTEKFAPGGRATAIVGCSEWGVGSKLKKGKGFS